MKRTIVTAFLSCVLPLSFCTEAAGDGAGAKSKEPEKKPATPQAAHYLFKDGEPTGQLYAPENSNALVLLAIEELQTHLEAITGKKLPMGYNSAEHFPYGRPRFSQMILKVRPEAEWKGKESPQAFSIEGDFSGPNRDRLIIEGNSSIGLLYGVYEYLHEQGVRFYAPGDEGTIIPRKLDIPISPGKRTCTPAAEARSMNISGLASSHFDMTHPSSKKMIDDYIRWYLRNRLMLERNVDNGEFPFIRISHGAGGHSLSGAREKADFDKEPDRFPMKSGKRHKGGQICWTNQKNYDAAVKTAIAAYDKLRSESGNSDLGYLNDMMDISLFDWGGALCECPECAKIAGSDPNKLDRLVWSFVNKVAKEVGKQRPQMKLIIFAPYLELTRPPADVKLEPNIVAQACRSEAWENKPENLASYPFTKVYLENVTAGVKAGAELAVYEYILWQGTPQPTDVLDSIAAYKKIAPIRYYHTETMQRNDLWQPLFWVMAKSLFDSSAEPREYLEQYCREYFGPENGRLVLEFYAALTENGRQMERRIYGDLPSTAALMTEALVGKFRHRFQSAANNASGRERDRIVRFRNAFEHAALTAEVVRAYAKALNERDEKSISDVKKRLDSFNKNFTNVKPYCSPEDYPLVMEIGKTDYSKLKPRSRKECTDEATYMDELFAGTTVPAKVENLFKLPESWLFRLDPWLEGQSKNFISPEFDDSKGWQLISTWNWFEEQGYYECGGQFWYRLKFKAPKFAEGKKVYLRIGSLDDSGDVYLNGKLVGQSLKSADWDKSFEMEITETLKQDAENTLVVRGYDAFGAGGLWRPSAIYTK